MSFHREQRMRMVERVGSELSLKEQAGLLSLSRSSLYYTPRPASEREVAIKHRIDAIYTACPFYGARKIARLLGEEGIVIARKTVGAYRQEMGLSAIYPKPHLSRPASEHRVYAYLLRGVKSSFPNPIWGIDIPYIRLLSGWMYLVAVLDWFSGYVLSWEIDQSLEIGFVLACVDAALTKAQPQIFNSDQGSHFTSPQYSARLEAAGVAISMDGRGRAMDNIFTERLWRTVKYEEVYLNDYQTPRQARQGLSRYFGFYNERRPHQSLAYQTPAQVYFGRDQDTAEKGAEPNLKIALSVS